MSTNPLRPDLNRANEIKSEKGDVKKSVGLFDIDYAMMTYLEDTVLPKLDYNGKSISIPVIYGNSERWKGARRDGIYRDGKGKIQLPLMMIRRTSIAKDDMVPQDKLDANDPHQFYTFEKKFSDINIIDDKNVQESRRELSSNSHAFKLLGSIKLSANGETTIDRPPSHLVKQRL